MISIIGTVVILFVAWFVTRSICKNVERCCLSIIDHIKTVGGSVPNSVMVSVDKEVQTRKSEGVGELPPEVIAPKLKKPPRPAGGFGTSVREQ